MEVTIPDGLGPVVDPGSPVFSVSPVQIASGRAVRSERTDKMASARLERSHVHPGRLTNLRTTEL